MFLGWVLFLFGVAGALLAKPMPQNCKNQDAAIACVCMLLSAPYRANMGKYSNHPSYELFRCVSGSELPVLCSRGSCLGTAKRNITLYSVLFCGLSSVVSSSRYSACGAFTSNTFQHFGGPRGGHVAVTALMWRTTRLACRKRWGSLPGQP